MQPQELEQAVDTPTIVDEVTLTMSVTDGNLVASIDKYGVVGTIIPVPIHVGKVSSRKDLEDFVLGWHLYLTLQLIIV